MSEKFFIDKTRQVLNKSNLKNVMPKLVSVIDDLKISASEKKDLKEYVFSEDAKTAANFDKNVKNGWFHKTKTLFFNFFGMNNNWPLGRNLLGGFMVHCPEYPTYFIPAFTQAKATGEATELKKGEGPRGLITGGLEGIAVGALVSGEILRLNEMIPYIILGASLQMFSCTVFPWLGEKIGRQIYLKRHRNTNNMTQCADISPIQDKKQPEVKKLQAFKGYSVYPTNGFLKI